MQSPVKTRLSSPPCCIAAVLGHALQVQAAAAAAAADTVAPLAQEAVV